MIRISKEFRFEASHILPKHPGKCSRLHGHSWRGWVTVEGQINPETGFVVDYAELKKLIEEHVVSKLDHTHLGHGVGSTLNTGQYWQPYFGPTFYPSSENLVVAIGKILQPFVKELPNAGARIYSVSLDETCTSRAEWYPTDPDRGPLEPGQIYTCDE